MNEETIDIKDVREGDVIRFTYREATTEGPARVGSMGGVCVGGSVVRYGGDDKPAPGVEIISITRPLPKGRVYEHRDGDLWVDVHGRLVWLGDLTETCIASGFALREVEDEWGALKVVAP